MSIDQPPGRRIGPSAAETMAAQLLDYQDVPALYQLLKRLPAELLPRHLPTIDELGDEEAIAYVSNLLEKREAARRRLEVSDELLRREFAGREGEIGKLLETEVLQNRENKLGDGQTADVMRFQYGNKADERIAVKYVLRPRESTLAADEEHDLLREVEQLKQIEAIEERIGAGKYIKVPHPYFYYQSGSIDCYGMEEIDGITLRQFREGAYDAQMKDDLRAAFAGIDRKVLDKEVQKFFEAMHTICLHGDIFVGMAGNLMVSRTGTFYVIDFGEATRGSTIDEQLDAFYKEETEKESAAARIEIGKFLDALLKSDA